MSSNIEKVKSIFKSPGIAAVLRWSKCVHVKVVAVCLITVLSTVFSLFFTLATKGLVDGAVSSNSDQLVKYALMLVGIILILGGLQYFPALALGPIVEHFQMLAAVAR